MADVSEYQVETNVNLMSILQEMKKMNATNTSLLLLIEQQNTLIKQQGDVLSKVAEATANSSSILSSVSSTTGWSSSMIRICSP
jgi:hypothetical protein